ncbi:MAG: aminoacyl-tRNA hydrolase [Myxococcales bacterium]
MLIVGLGNPGPQYQRTRHNAGFLVLDAFAALRHGAFGRVVAFRARREFEGRYADFEIERAGKRERVGLLKPETFMNLSGRSVRAAMAFYEVAPDELLVVHDELDVPFGELRLKLGGGDGGHRGLRSITAELATPSYGRLRVGIGRPSPDFPGDIADFVLQAFALEEESLLGNVLADASQAVEAVITDGLSRTMNRTNQRTVR